MLSTEDLFRPPDRYDECYECHETAQLWADYNEPGDFYLCADCIRREEKHRNKGDSKCSESTNV